MNSRGPGSTPLSFSAAIMIAVAALPGMPRVSIGMVAAPVVAFFAVSGAPSPSSIPVPNRSPRLETCFSTP